jgi:hypothetical protein
MGAGGAGYAVGEAAGDELNLLDRKSWIEAGV